jgi:hypothetical protein
MRFSPDLGGELPGHFRVHRRGQFVRYGPAARDLTRHDFRKCPKCPRKVPISRNFSRGIVTIPETTALLDNRASACSLKFARGGERKRPKDFYRKGAKIAKKMDRLQIVAENVTKWYET